MAEIGLTGTQMLISSTIKCFKRYQHLNDPIIPTKCKFMAKSNHLKNQSRENKCSKEPAVFFPWGFINRSNQTSISMKVQTKLVSAVLGKGSLTLFSNQPMTQQMMVGEHGREAASAFRDEISTVLRDKFPDLLSQRSDAEKQNDI